MARCELPLPCRSILGNHCLARTGHCTKRKDLQSLQMRAMMNEVLGQHARFEQVLSHRTRAPPGRRRNVAAYTESLFSTNNSTYNSNLLSWRLNHTSTNSSRQLQHYRLISSLLVWLWCFCHLATAASSSPTLCRPTTGASMRSANACSIVARLTASSLPCSTRPRFAPTISP